MIEIWKDVEGYNGMYKISNLGVLVSLYKSKPKVVKFGITKKGYKYAILSNKRTTKFALIHRIVAQTFISNTDNLPEVNHKNLNKLDNNAKNLEWVTSRGNITHYHDTNKKTSKYIGVSFNNANNKYVAHIYINGKDCYIGTFISDYFASLAYNKVAQNATEEMINKIRLHFNKRKRTSSL